MFQKINKYFGGGVHRKEIQKNAVLVEQINALEGEYEALSLDALKAKTGEFKTRLAQGESLDQLLPEAFAAVREASKRTIGLRHFDVQLIGGITLHKGQIAEMKTGEGKTLVATLPIYLNALSGKGVHLVTVNDYLARRDARWMAPIFHLLGLSIGVLQMANRTENGKKAFLVDLDRHAAHEDQHQLKLVERVEAYQADVTYGTNSEFGFDYLRDNLTMRLSDRVQRGHAYAIVDEVDNILIDEARTPLIISGPAQDEAENYNRIAQVVRSLRPEDYEVNEKNRSVALTEVGEAHVEEILGMALQDPERPEDLTPEQARTLGYIAQALKAQHLFHRNKDYLVQGGKVVIVDEFTGRLMPGRRWSEGLHQAVEAKEGVKVEPENITYATITLQNYFRMYAKLSGMTGTAETEAEEFSKIYKLEVLPIPTNLEYVALRRESELSVVESRDEDGYKFQYYARRSDPDLGPAFWRRKDYPDVVYRTAEGKLRAITLEILRYFVVGRPQLVGTTSVEHSERLSDRLSAEPLRRLAQTLIVRDAWLKSNSGAGEMTDIKELRYLNKPIDQLNIGEMRQMGKSLGLVNLNPEDASSLTLLRETLHLSESDGPRLLAALQGGIPHRVLNARKHDEESQIIAKAGAFAAVTIATNMAGRGVDIKLGGELPDEILADVIHVLTRTGHDPYNQPHARLRELLDAVPREEWGVQEPSVLAFCQYLDDMKRVRELGGLHVIGSERHEARRIDNQLRGRAARQGDPGSSRFYLSLEDDLMRLFGGARAEMLMSAFNIDPSVPIESRMLGRIVEQSQERVEGNNFDVRKHLLEYDDVLNEQRKRIYGERDMVFTKTDLRQDVLGMLKTELANRVSLGLQDRENPWKLLAFLEEIQPGVYYESEKTLIPSYTLVMLLDLLLEKTGSALGDREKIRSAMLDIAREALFAEKAHLLFSTGRLLESSREAYSSQAADRMDTLDAFFEGLRDAESDSASKRPQELLDELSQMVRASLRLPAELLQELPTAAHVVKKALQDQIEQSLLQMNLIRVMGAFERRLSESLPLKLDDLKDLDWAEAASRIQSAVEMVVDKRVDRLVGDSQSSLVGQNIDNLLSRLPYAAKEDLLLLLMLMSQGARMEIDSRTHQRSLKRVTLLNYIFLGSQLLQQKSEADAAAEIENHLRTSLEQQKNLWGQIELQRLITNQVSVRQFDENLRQAILDQVPSDQHEGILSSALSDIPADLREIVAPLLGERIQNELFRHILLSGISELWIDYLTRMEALRVSITLESYAQRDPLVMYKSRATELFGTLLSDIRLTVISRIFKPRLQRPSENAGQAARTDAPQQKTAAPLREPPPSTNTGEKKRKRHRH